MYLLLLLSVLLQDVTVYLLLLAVLLRDVTVHISYLSTGFRLLCWLSCNSSALLCRHACPMMLLLVVANVCLIFSLSLPQCVNLSSKGHLRCFLLVMVTEPVVWCAPMSADFLVPD